MKKMFKSRWWLGLVIMGLCLAILIPASAADTRPRIAVVDFDDGSITDHWWGSDFSVGKGVSDVLYQSLYEQKKFRLLERQQIEQILKEQNFGTGGRIDPSTAPQLGKLLGAEYILFGNVTEFHVKSNKVRISVLWVYANIASVKINGRLVSTKTGEMVALAKGAGEVKENQAGIWTWYGPISFSSENFEKTILGKALSQAVDQFAVNLGNEADNVSIESGTTAPSTALIGKVVAVSGSRVSINIGSSQGVAKDMVFTIAHNDGALYDPTTGAYLGDNLWDICEVTVSNVQANLSSGTITTKITDDAPRINDIATQKL